MIHLVVKFILAWLVRKATSCCTKQPPLVLGWRDYLKNIVPVGMHKDQLLCFKLVSVSVATRSYAFTATCASYWIVISV